MTYTPREQRLIQNGLLSEAINQHGEPVLKCNVCQQLDGHRPDCSVEARLVARR